MRMFAWRNRQRWLPEEIDGTRWFEVTVYNIHRVEVLQSAGCFCELQGYFRIVESRVKWGPGIRDEGDSF